MSTRLAVTACCEMLHTVALLHFLGRSHLICWVYHPSQYHDARGFSIVAHLKDELADS
jgi:hypothetical protein